MTRRQTAGSLTGGLILIGLAVIILVKDLSFFPLILAVIGIAILPGSILKEGWRHALTASSWLIGLALCFHFNIFWPGILILIGITLILEGLFSKRTKKHNIFDEEE